MESQAEDRLLKLERTLGELELLFGSRARPLVEDVRRSLRRVRAGLAAGNPQSARASLAAAIERVMSLGAELTPLEAEAMRLLATTLAQAVGTDNREVLERLIPVIGSKAGMNHG